MAKSGARPSASNCNEIAGARVKRYVDNFLLICEKLMRKRINCLESPLEKMGLKVSVTVFSLTGYQIYQ